MRYLVLLAFLAIGCGGSAPLDDEREAASGGSGSALDTGGATTGGDEPGGAAAIGGYSTGGATSGGRATGGMQPCPIGSETCSCYGNDTCDDGLTCLSGLCVDAGTGGEGSGGTGGDDGGTGGVVTEECTWENATELAWPNRNYEIRADSCLVFGEGDLTVPMTVLVVGNADTILFDWQNVCGESGSSGFLPGVPTELSGCTTLFDFTGDSSTATLRWW